jgi:hypothetical protein
VKTLVLHKSFDGQPAWSTRLQDERCLFFTLSPQDKRVAIDKLLHRVREFNGDQIEFDATVGEFLLRQWTPDPGRENGGDLFVW